jgi:hypothetical protein
VAAYAAISDGKKRRFPAKRSVIISQSSVTSQAAAAQFPDTSQVVKNGLGTRAVWENCNQLGDCLEALHARTSRLVQTPPSTGTNLFFKNTGVGGTLAYDNEVLLEPIFQALPAMEHLLSIVIPFSQPLTVTSSLGLGVQNRWIPDETETGYISLTFPLLPPPSFLFVCPPPPPPTDPYPPSLHPLH